MDSIPLRKIVNLAKLYGYLFSKCYCPISILKYVSFDQKVPKLQRLFVNVCLDHIFAERATIQKVFAKCS